MMHYVYDDRMKEGFMQACKLCGGTAGTFSPAGNHYLCEARAAHGQPTPALGDRCPACKGSGVKPGRRGGVLLSFEEGPARIARSIASQFPKCEQCQGTGVSSGK